LADDSPAALERAAEIVCVLLTSNKRSRNTGIPQGHIPLILHIISMSRLTIDPTNNPGSHFLDSCSQSLSGESTQQQLEEALEKLYACNTMLYAGRSLRSLKHSTIRTKAPRFYLSPLGNCRMTPHQINELHIIRRRIPTGIEEQECQSTAGSTCLVWVGTSFIGRRQGSMEAGQQLTLLLSCSPSHSAQSEAASSLNKNPGLN
jgi:hypothetical protein